MLRLTPEETYSKTNENDFTVCPKQQGDGESVTFSFVDDIISLGLNVN